MVLYCSNERYFKFIVKPKTTINVLSRQIYFCTYLLHVTIIVVEIAGDIESRPIPKWKIEKQLSTYVIYYQTGILTNLLFHRYNLYDYNDIILHTNFWTVVVRWFLPWEEGNQTTLSLTTRSLLLFSLSCIQKLYYGPRIVLVSSWSQSDERKK